MTSQGDVAERKKNRELDALRRETSAVARLLKQAGMHELHQDLEQVKEKFDYVELRLSGESTESE